MLFNSYYITLKILTKQMLFTGSRRPLERAQDDRHSRLHEERKRGNDPVSNIIF